ncbi:hypothetical protein GUJ93_ZPchr0009g1347 [Zizania palustris]|uniref:Secreted protein n=1 Tax=Zizania palustris TaxID=103762 RepID=A0A8J5VMC9_ZIZPA|nr:hypothetical protein GUJ93_ZPchr0009g1347 [Zizania palustris]
MPRPKLKAQRSIHLGISLHLLLLLSEAVPPFLGFILLSASRPMQGGLVVRCQKREGEEEFTKLPSNRSYGGKRNARGRSRTSH